MRSALAAIPIFLACVSPAGAWCQFDDLRCKALEAEISQSAALDRLSDQLALDSIMRQNAAQMDRLNAILGRLNVARLRQGLPACYWHPFPELAC